MMGEREPPTAADEQAALIARAHVADGAQQLPPGRGDFPRQASCGTSGGCRYRDDRSIECGWREAPNETGPRLATRRGAAWAADR